MRSLLLTHNIWITIPGRHGLLGRDCPACVWCVILIVHPRSTAACHRVRRRRFRCPGLPASCSHIGGPDQRSNVQTKTTKNMNRSLVQFVPVRLCDPTVVRRSCGHARCTHATVTRLRGSAPVQHWKPRLCLKTSTPLDRPVNPQ